VSLFKNSIWFGKTKSLKIDSIAFTAFCQITPSLLVLESVMVSARQFFGHPIKCDTGGSAGFVNEDVLESYCWMYANFRIPADYQGPCSSSLSQTDSFHDVDGPIYNSYYQWIPIYLIFLAVLFYLPRCIWLMMEGGLMKFFGKGTTTRMIEDPDEKRDKLVKFFKDNIHNKYNIYYFGFIVCEFLNFVVVLVAVGMTNRFLNGQFLWYGFKVWNYYSLPPEEQKKFSSNPMCTAFPRIASCNYHRFGTAGEQGNLNAICILALNIINDKVFLVLWWWFLVLVFLGVIRIVFRIVQINSAKLRFSLLDLRMHRYFKRDSNSELIKTYVCNCSRGDWFVLYQLSKNLNRPFFMDFLKVLVRSVKDPEKGGTAGMAASEDGGDGIMEMMLKPTLATYESKDDKSKHSDDDDD